MILWKDFVLDHEIGPCLVDEQIMLAIGEGPQMCRDERSGDPCVMEDAIRGHIQETGQELSPARMVGYSSSDSYSHPNGRDAGGVRLDTDSRRREGE